MKPIKHPNDRITRLSNSCYPLQSKTIAVAEGNAVPRSGGLPMTTNGSNQLLPVVVSSAMTVLTIILTTAFHATRQGNHFPPRPLLLRTYLSLLAWPALTCDERRNCTDGTGRQTRVQTYHKTHLACIVRRHFFAANCAFSSHLAFSQLHPLAKSIAIVACSTDSRKLAYTWL